MKRRPTSVLGLAKHLVLLRLAGVRLTLLLLIVTLLASLLLFHWCISVSTGG